MPPRAARTDLVAGDRPEEMAPVALRDRSARPAGRRVGRVERAAALGLAEAA